MDFASALIEGSLNNRLILLPSSSSDPLAFPHRLTPGAARLGQAAAASLNIFKYFHHKYKLYQEN